MSGNKHPLIEKSGVPYGKIAAAFAGYEAGLNVFNRLRSRYESRFSYTVTLTDRDPMYYDVHSWLLGLLPEEHHRSLIVGTRRSSGNYYAEVSEDSTSSPEEAKPLQVMFNDSRPRKMVLDGQKVTVELEKPESSGGNNNSRMSYEPEKIIFTSWTKAGQDAVLRHLERIHKTQKKERKPLLRMVTSWGNWRSRADLPARPLGSVMLPPAQKNRIVEDLRQFLDAEDQYNKLAIPWHRGYMFHGPPGTGKTSLVKALAAEFRLDLWYISLSDLTGESSLMELISEVSERSILLLEDIDTMKITKDREATGEGKSTLTMSSLLNALDGVATPHGLITIMTTNHFEKLDAALTRPGRMDVIEKIDMPTWTEVEEMFRYFYGTEMDRSLIPAPLTGTPPRMSTVAEMFKRNLGKPEAALAELGTWVGEMP